jgi:hypothetical protein
MTAETIPVASQADARVRSAPKPVVADPDAPFGYMKDPKTGEVRPRKRPGKQVKSAPAPPSRPSNAARTAPSTGKKDYTGPLSDTVQGLWMILAGIPTPEKQVKFGGLDLQAASIRMKAEAAILEANGTRVVHAVNIMAQHNKQVAKGIEKWAADTGPAWVLPVMMTLLPFAVQSASVWNAPVEGDITLLAKSTEAKFDELVKGMMAPTATQEPSPNGDHPAA